jgi:hypothetical protein
LSLLGNQNFPSRALIIPTSLEHRFPAESQEIFQVSALLNLWDARKKLKRLFSTLDTGLIGIELLVILRLFSKAVSTADVIVTNQETSRNGV